MWIQSRRGRGYQPILVGELSSLNCFHFFKNEIWTATSYLLSLPILSRRFLLINNKSAVFIRTVLSVWCHGQPTVISLWSKLLFFVSASVIMQIWILIQRKFCSCYDYRFSEAKALLEAGQKEYAKMAHPDPYVRMFFRIISFYL